MSAGSPPSAAPTIAAMPPMAHAPARIALLGAALLVGAATTPTACTGDGECASCGAPATVGALQSPDLTETSGVAASARHDGVFYAHNDSGDSSRFFAFSREGDDLATFKVQNAQNVDWEDIAVGPCDAGSCVYIADIGDNELARLAVTLYRVAEPDAIVAGETTLPSERIVVTYPEGAQDAEVLLVHPDTGVVTVVTKVADGPAAIYELPLPLTTGMTLMAAKKGELMPPAGDARFTAGSIAPDASAILMRTHDRLFLYPMEPGQSAAEALAGAACSLRVADEMLGEAVTWLADGSGFMTAGEGEGAAIHVTTCDS